MHQAFINAPAIIHSSGIGRLPRSGALTRSVSTRSHSGRPLPESTAAPGLPCRFTL